MSQILVTHVNNHFRKEQGLSCSEYVLADMIYFLSSDSEVIGWCTESKQSLADAIGITRIAVLNIVKRLVEKGFLIKDSKTSFLRTTNKWNAVYFSTEQKQQVKF